MMMSVSSATLVRSTTLLRNVFTTICSCRSAPRIRSARNARSTRTTRTMRPPPHLTDPRSSSSAPPSEATTTKKSKRFQPSAKYPRTSDVHLRIICGERDGGW